MWNDMTRITLEDAAAFLQGQNDFMILTHKNPDGDTLGSAIALCHALRACGKEAYVFPNEGATERYAPWLNAVTAPLGHRSGCILSVDTAAVDMLPNTASALASQVALALDHHISHREYAAQTFVNPDAAACGEIIWRLVQLLHVPVTREIAEAIYIAVSTDTSCFLNSNTTAETHRIVAELYPYGVDFETINRMFFILKTKARLALEAALIQNMHFYHHGQIAIVQITLALISETGATEDDLDNISSLTRSIEGVEVGIVVREREPGVSKISMRSSSRADVSRICSHFGGGGHIRAAGCTIALPPAQAEEKLIAEIDAHKLY